MASSRKVAVALGSLLLAQCSVGHGEGDIYGTVSVADCDTTGRYELSPSAFFAQDVEHLLRIRVQRGSDLEVRSDGLAVLVSDASRLKREFLGQQLDVAAEDPRVNVSVYLNESCPPGRDRTPVVLGAVSGTIKFNAIYAPRVDDDEVQIQAELNNVRFEDPRDDKRSAVLSGYFDFLYTRGSPAQRFP